MLAIASASSGRLGSALFGHFGDRIGRKTTLVAALLTMGVSTVLIGILPTYKTVGVAAPAMLALCRFGQGLGLGGEWGGAVLLAVENAPPGKRAWYGMFPQLGAPLGFFLSGSVFLLLSDWLTNEQFFAYGWRIPFLASAALVLVGLYVRLTITETPVFREALVRDARVKVPMVVVFREYPGPLVFGILTSLATFVLFYLMTVFALSWGTTALGYSRGTFLIIQLVGVCFFALAIPISAMIAERGRRRTLLWVTAAIGAFGFVMAPLLSAGLTGATLAMVIGLSLMGLTYGPLGTALSELFPTRVRYTGSSLAFNLSGIVGASLAPYIAMAGPELRSAARRLLPHGAHPLLSIRRIAGDPRASRATIHSANLFRSFYCQSRSDDGREETRFSNQKVANSSRRLLSSAAVLTVYTAGYLRTRPAAQRFAVESEPRKIAIPARSESPQSPSSDTGDHDADRDAAPRAAAASAAPTLAARSTPASSSTPLPIQKDEGPAISEQTAPPPDAPDSAAAPLIATEEPAPSIAPAERGYKDGTYLGWGSCRHGDIEASVVIQEGRIASATITRCLTRYSCSWIDELPGQVVSRQNTNVDYVSGATQSTDAFADAVADALSKAK